MKWIKKTADFKPIPDEQYLVAFLADDDPNDPDGLYWDYGVIISKPYTPWDDVEYFIPASQMNPTINC